MKFISQSTKLLVVLVTWIALSGSAVLARHSDAEFCKFAGNSLILKGRKPAINCATGEPFFFLFVNNSLANGNGTFESPFNNIADAQAASAENVIVYVYPTGTSTNMDTGISLLHGQQILGAGICQTIKTAEGKVKIPAQSTGGLAMLSNAAIPTSAPFVAAVRCNAGNNVVSGLSLFDALGCFCGGLTSCGLEIDSGTGYLIKNNQLSTAIGNGMDILGGGDIKVKHNSFLATSSGDIYALLVLTGIFGVTNSLQGSIEIKENLFAGIDACTGWTQSIHVDAYKLDGNVCMSIEDNLLISAYNTTPYYVDTTAGIDIFAGPVEGQTMTFNIKRNLVTLPACVPVGPGNPLAGVSITAGEILGPKGPTIAKLDKNISVNSYGVPGYLFCNKGGLKVCFGDDNIGTVSNTCPPALQGAGKVLHGQSVKA